MSKPQAIGPSNEFFRNDSIAELSSDRQNIIASWKQLGWVWKLVVLSCLLLGLFFRLGDLNHKVYQYDETFTSLRLSGYTEVEAVQTLTARQAVSVADLQKYQLPNDQRSVMDTVTGLAAEEPQLTPFYFVLTYAWAGLLGGSVGVIRLLSAIVSLLTLPALWWLAVELFSSATAAWLSVSLLAVSPFQILYAQEARPQSLWLLMTIVSSTLLLRAMRRKTEMSWLLYGLSLTLSLYTYLFAGFVAIAHASYLLLLNRFRITRCLLWGGLAIGLSGLAFLPWLIAVVTQIDQVNVAVNWAIRDRLLLPDAFKMVLHHLTVSFVDRGRISLPLPVLATFSLVGWGLRCLLPYAFYVLCRKAPLRISLFLLTLTVVPLLGLVLPDLLLGGTRSTVPRYVVPVYLGLNLALSGFLARELVPLITTHFRRPAFWRIVTVILLSAGVASCTLIASSDRWWSKMVSNNNRAVAEQVNQAERPLIISDAGSGDLWSLSHYLDPKVKLLVRPQCYTCNTNRSLVDQPYLPSIPAGYSDVFLFQPRPSELWLKRLSQQTSYRLTLLSQGFDNWFWKVDR